MAKKTYTTVTDVPLIRVGQWNPAVGDGTVTVDMLEGMAAANADKRLNLPVIKKGHTDDRFDNPDFFNQDDQDGEPAYGQVANCRVTNDEGGTLVGDFINIPEDLAESMASEYPYRSVEFYQDLTLLDEKGAEIEKFPIVLTAVALLGAQEPAVSGLGAIHEAYTKRKAVHMRKGATRYALGGGHTMGSLRDALSKALESLVAGDGTYTWVRDLDDEYVIYEVEGPNDFRLYKRPFLISEDGTVTLVGDPVEVFERRSFEPVAETGTVPHPAAMSRDSDVVTPPNQVADIHVSHHKEGAPMFTEEQVKKLRDSLGLGEDLTDEQILAALTQAGTTEEDQETPEEPAGDNQGTEDEQEQEAATEAPAVAASKVPETVQVSAAAFSQLQTEHKAMSAEFAKLKAKADAERRDGIIAAAFAAGKLHPTEKAAFRAALDEAEEQTVKLIDARHPAFPTQELGSATAAYALNTGSTLAEAQAETDKTFFGKGN